MKGNNTLITIGIITLLVLLSSYVTAEPHVFWEDPIAKVTNTSIISLSYSGYDYGVNQTQYQAYYKSSISAGDSIRYCRLGYCFTIQPTKLTYRNNLGSNDDLYSSPNINSIGYPSGNVFKWDDLFGTSDLTYSYNYDNLKEELVIESEPRAPATYLGSNVTLDLDTYIKYPVGVDMYINGTKVITNTRTSQKIEFRNASGEVLYYLPEPYAEDALGNRISLEYQVVFNGKYNANKERLIYFYTKTPYDFINNSWYPVKIDPTVTFSTASVTSLSSSPLSNNSFVLAYCDDTNDDILLSVYDTEGNNLTGIITVDDNIGTCDLTGVKSVSVSSLNNTGFVVAYLDQTDDDASFKIYNSLGINLTGEIDVDSDSGYNPSSISVSSFNSTDFVIGWEDYGSDYLRLQVYNKWGNNKTTPLVVRTGLNSAPNQIAVSTFNSTHFVVVYSDKYDSDSFSSTYTSNLSLINSLEISTTKKIEGMEVRTMNSTTFVVGFIQTTDDYVAFQVRDIWGNIITTTNIIDSTSGDSETNIGLSSFNSTDFVISWYTKNVTRKGMRFASYNYRGALKLPDTKTSLGSGLYPNTITFRETATGLQLCNNNFIIAYVNSTTNAVWESYNANGTAWDGVCPTSISVQYLSRNMSESISIADVRYRWISAVRAGSDTTSPSEGLAPTNIKNRKAADIFTPSEGIKRLGVFSRLSSDVYSISEGINRIWATLKFGQDSFSLGEYAMRLFHKRVSSQDTISVMDSMFRLGVFTKQSSDLLTINEIEVALKGITLRGQDTISVNELLTKLNIYNPHPADIVTFQEQTSDKFLFIRLGQDLINVNDLLRFFRNYPKSGQDTISVGELISVLYNRYRLGQDTVAMNDHSSRLVIYSRRLADSLAINDAVSKISQFYIRLAQLLNLFDNANSLFTEGIHIRSSILPATPTSDDNLLGYCNASFPNDENVTYRWKWYNGSTIFSQGNTSVPYNTTLLLWQYQETGTIYQDANASKTAWRDGNWTTGDTVTNNETILYSYVNYTLLPGTTNATSQVRYKYGSTTKTYNSTLPNFMYDCIEEGQPVQFRVELYWPPGDNPYGYLQCWDYNLAAPTYGWTSLRTLAGSGDLTFIEEGLWMNASQSVLGGFNYTYYPSGQELNLANISNLNTTVGEVWTFSCMASNGTSNSSWVNSSISLANSYTFSLGDLLALVEAKITKYGWYKSMADIFNLREGSLKNTIFSRQGATLLTIYDLRFGRSEIFTRFGESVSISEAYSRIYAAQRRGQDRISVSELLDILGLYGRDTYESLSLGELLRRGILTTKFDQLTFEDSAYRTRLFNLRGSDTFGVQELLDLLSGISVKVGDSLSLGELIIRLGIMNRDSYESLGISEGSEFWFGILVDLGESFSFKEGIDRISYYLRYGAESISLDLWTNRFDAYQVLVSQLLTLHENLDLLRSITVFGSDVVEVIDGGVDIWHGALVSVQDVLTIYSDDFQGRYSCIIGTCSLQGGTVVVNSGGGGKIYVPTAAGLLDITGSAYLTGLSGQLRDHALWWLIALLFLVFITYLVVRVRYERLKNAVRRENAEKEAKKYQ